MSGLTLVAGVMLVLLHRLDGGTVLVNPAQIVSLHSPAPAGGRARLFTGAVRCAIGLTDGKWLSVLEACDRVQGLLEEAGRR